MCLRHRLFISCFHRDAAEQTVAWLDYIAIPYRDLCFVADKSLVDADIYIEDAEKIIRHVHEGSMRDD